MLFLHDAQVFVTSFAQNTFNICCASIWRAVETPELFHLQVTSLSRDWSQLWLKLFSCFLRWNTKWDVQWLKFLTHLPSEDLNACVLFLGSFYADFALFVLTIAAWFLLCSVRERKHGMSKWQNSVNFTCNIQRLLRACCQKPVKSLRDVQISRQPPHALVSPGNGVACDAGH